MNESVPKNICFHPQNSSESQFRQLLNTRSKKQKCEALIAVSTPRPQSFSTYLAASSTQSSEISDVPSPSPAHSRLSILHDVPLSCITACIEGRGRRSADPLCFDRDFRRPPSSSLLEKIEARGKRRRRSARLVAFRGLWKCVHVEYDPRDENRKSRGLSSLASLP